VTATVAVVHSQWQSRLHVSHERLRRW